MRQVKWHKNITEGDITHLGGFILYLYILFVQKDQIYATWTPKGSTTVETSFVEVDIV